VSDVVEAYSNQLSETSMMASSYYNGTTKKRAYYLAPVKRAVEPFHT